MPTYALFQSDRSSRGDDSEVQDPMKLAIAEALRSVPAELDRVMQSVKEKATEVATRTLAKLQEVDPKTGGSVVSGIQGRAETGWSIQAILDWRQ